MHVLDLTRPIDLVTTGHACARRRILHIAPVFTGILGPATWLAVAVCASVILRLSGAGDAGVMALAGTASLVYLGTAVLSGRVSIAGLDLVAAGLTASMACGLAEPATALVGHALWGALRASAGAAAPGRRFAIGWSVTWAAMALLLGLSA